jgi:two-component system KDP operon response regulator KdpE
MHHQRILIVDDDPAMIKLLRVNLETRGYAVAAAPDGDEALHALEKYAPDLVILDIMMPGIDGYEVCQRMREWTEIPIIMLTALSQTKNKVEGLEIGADDYMTKPFTIDELIARVRALLRRSKTDNTTPLLSSFRRGDLKVDFSKRLVTIAGSEIRLTPTEYNLLQELVLNADRVLTNSHLLSKVWGSEYGQEKEYLRVYISRLRAKLKSGSQSKFYIATIPGVGYKFNA